MTDRPILFSSPMIRALIDGRKTQTRRVLKPQPEPEFIGAEFHADSMTLRPAMLAYGPTHKALLRLPRPGDRLWCREAHYLTDDGDNEYAVYAADEADVRDHNAKLERLAGTVAESIWQRHAKLRPSIHMPRWASRLTLIVTDVRVQRLQAISEEDAIAEGVPDALEGNAGDKLYCSRCQGFGVHGALGDRMGYIEVDCRECATAQQRFRNLWNSINGPGAWESNPWVSAISFSVHKANIDALPRQQGRASE